MAYSGGAELVTAAVKFLRTQTDDATRAVVAKIDAGKVTYVSPGSAEKLSRMQTQSSLKEVCFLI